MANVVARLGLRAVISGAAGTAPRITRYTRTSTGVIGEGAMLYKAEAGPAVFNGTTAAHETSILGSAVHYVGATGTEIFVYDDPKQEFLLQGDTAVADPILAIGRYTNLVSATAHNATTLQSKLELDSSEVTSIRAALDVVQIRRLWESEDNDQDAAAAKWVVQIPEQVHLFSSGRSVVT